MSEPQFVGSFPRADASLDPPLPAVAFIGRSNVGKSSLLNALLGQRVARVSASPGKTRAMNVFLIPAAADPDAQRPAPHKSLCSLLRAPCYFLDLPGYGYARVSKAERTAFRRLLHHLLDRPGLQGVVWLLDIRHPPSTEDLAMQDALAERATPVLAVATKADKLPRRQREIRAADVARALGFDPDQVLITSTRTGEGLEDLRDSIAALLARPVEQGRSSA